MTASPGGRVSHELAVPAAREAATGFTLEVAPESAHPRLVRIDVDDVPVGDLCFRSTGTRDRFLAALVGCGATVAHVTELIRPYDHTMFEPPVRTNRDPHPLPTPAGGRP